MHVGKQRHACLGVKGTFRMGPQIAIPKRVPRGKTQTSKSNLPKAAAFNPLRGSVSYDDRPKLGVKQKGKRREGQNQLTGSD